ncbi:ADAMTS-like protein 3, partial [Pteropus alecto]
QTSAEKATGAYFLPEFALSPQGSFLEDTTGEQFLTYRYDDQAPSKHTSVPHAMAARCPDGLWHTRTLNFMSV